ncbi:MAG TPA: ribbon-helix-helix domain-containing protein [Armatimonadota bacterium]|nr:ribbon-helix-helix domain-containing protein [Armatimonadota bacterium]
MPSHTIKVTGVPEELVRLLDERIKRRHAAGRSEYLRELIRKDVLGEERSLREILAPIHEFTRSLPDTEEELDTFFDEVRDEVSKEKQAKTAH